MPLHLPMYDIGKSGGKQIAEKDMQLKAAGAGWLSTAVHADRGRFVFYAEMGEIHKWQMAVRHAIRT